MIKCVVWDLDDTVWPGVAIEQDVTPTPYPEVLRAMDVLAGRGIVSSAASRTDPSLTAAVTAHPELAGRLVAPQLGWGPKSEALLRIADELGVAVEALAFVDDSPFERAEVAAVLPGVLVLGPDELRLDRPEFTPAVVTDEARARPRRYREEQARRAAEREHAGSREAFLRASGLELTVGPARPEDVPRVAELAERTHRFNTTGEPWPADRIASLIGDPGWFVPVARLRDRFGEYGLISTALVERHPRGLAAWQPRLFMVSCRAAGRDVPRAVLGWIMRRALADGARQLLVDLRPSNANLELRLLLRGTGFTAADPAAGSPAPGTVLLARTLDSDLPEVPWLRLIEECS
jgi:FkbH-like protein